MTRILSTAIATLFGLLAGFILEWIVDYDYIMIAVTLFLASAGFKIGDTDGLPFGKKDEKVMQQGLDMALITFWGARPGMDRYLDCNLRYDIAEGEIIDTCIPFEIYEKIYNRDEMISFVRASARTESAPLAAIKRHKRAFKPSIFRKKSATYTVLKLVADALILAGPDRRGIVWYYHVGKTLGVPPKDAHYFLDQAIKAQIRRPMMIPSWPKEGTLLTTASKGLPITEELEYYLNEYDKGRKAILETMFPDDEEEAA